MTNYSRPLVPEDLGPRYAEAVWRRSFVRASTASILGQIQRADTGEILRAAWPDDDRAGNDPARRYCAAEAG